LLWVLQEALLLAQRWTWNFDDIVDTYETLVRDLQVDELELGDCGIR
jgi:hypothetical protein